MSNERIESWLKLQRKMVEPGGEAACKVILVGPDNDVWATWSLEDEAVHRSVDDTLLTQGEDLPRGVYRCKLVSLDARGNQLAMLPVRITGRSANDLGAGGEAQALQRATSMLTGTFEQVLMSMTQRDAEQEKRINSLIEDRAILLEEFNKAQSENLDIEFKREEHAQKMSLQHDLFEMLKELAPPVLLPAMNAWLEEKNVEREARLKRLKAKAAEKEQQAAPFPPGYPGGNTPEPKPATQGAKDQPGGSSASSEGRPAPAAATVATPPSASPSATLKPDGGDHPTEPPHGGGPDGPAPPPRPAPDGAPSAPTGSRSRSASVVKRSSSARRRPAGAKR